MNSCLLAIECSCDVASLCIKRGGEAFERELPEPHSQAALLVSELESLMTEAKITYPDLTDLAFTVGPGSFTSIRIGLAVSRTILGEFPAIRAHPFTTLECLAAACPDSPIEARLKAGKGEVYRQFFERRSPPPLSGEGWGGVNNTYEHRAGRPHTQPRPKRGRSDSQQEISSPLYATTDIELVPQTEDDLALAKPHARYLLAAMQSITIPQDRTYSPLYIRAPDAKVSTKAHF